jgi:hypothetical protein
MNDTALYRSSIGFSPRWLPDRKKQTPSPWSRVLTYVYLLGLVAIGLAIAYLFIIMAVGAATAQQAAPMQPPLQPVSLVLEDQFERKADLADLRGQVVILVYGDRKANETCRKLGESLHICWHPEAKSQPPAKAQTAPVVPLENLKPGQLSTNVLVVPVACCGKPPALIRGAIRKEIAKNSPDVVVWLDFGDILKGMFGQSVGEPNVLVFDAAGSLRMRINGTPDQHTMDKLVKDVQFLRYEALK